MKPFSIVLVALAFVGLTALPAAADPIQTIGVQGLQLAHSGGMSPKDGCHRDKKANERHWHEQGTNKVAGLCVKVDGKSYKVPKTVLDKLGGPTAACEHQLKWLAGERSNSRGEFIFHNMSGNPVLVKSDAVKLVRACRQRK